MEPDFSGYASKAGLKCADGLTILAHAFRGQDGTKVPLVWQHIHDDPEMVLGHAIVEDRPDGTYIRGFFNDGPMAQQAKRMLAHKDVDSMSIYANRLVKRGADVVHGILTEVSLVLAGANPGAFIDTVSIQHELGVQGEWIDAIITTGLPLETELMHSVTTNEGDTMADEAPKGSLAEVYMGLDDQGKKLVQYLVGKFAEEDSDDVKHAFPKKEDEELDDKADDSDDSEDSDEEVPNKKSKKSPAVADKDDTDDEDDSEEDDDSDDKIKHSNDSKENLMTHRAFDSKTKSLDGMGATLSHSQLETIVTDAKRRGSLKDSFLAHAGDFGIDNINLLFPDAKAISTTPEFISRRMEWVSEVITKTKHVPFARIKTLAADITADEARAKGYVTGSLKKDEVFGLLHRITTPTTIYKKQKLDRDDKIDITDIDIVVFLKTEMRLMLEEEIARAILLGDGREASDPDKVKDPGNATEGAGIRSIANDNSIYSHHVQLASGSEIETRIDELVRARSFYRGSGSPVLFTTLTSITDMLLSRDKLGRRMYSSIEELATGLLASKIVPVDPMEDHQDLVGIYVNLSDYSVGTDRGGEISFFDDFDIDYNQEKYLLETRCSGALTKLKSAVVVRRALGTLVTPTGPSFNAPTNTITLPDVTGVEYFVDGVEDAGEVVITEDVIVTAKPAAGYDFPTGVTTVWPFNFSA